MKSEPHARHMHTITELNCHVVARSRLHIALVPLDHDLVQVYSSFIRSFMDINLFTALAGWVYSVDYEGLRPSSKVRL